MSEDKRVSEIVLMDASTKLIEGFMELYKEDLKDCEMGLWALSRVSGRLDHIGSERLMFMMGYMKGKLV